MFQNERVRLAAIITLVMVVMIMLVSKNQTGDRRFWLVIGLIVVMAIIQMVILLRGGPQGSALQVARRYYMQGNFDAAINLLEDSLADTANPDVEALALLGNTYRQQGRLEQSEKHLQRAVGLDAGNNLALYGLGQTLLAQGRYNEAAELIQSALTQGIRKAVQVDLLLANYLANTNPQHLLELAHKVSRLLGLEDYRALMLNYLLYNLVENEQPTALRYMQNSASGLAYWQSQARRFAETDYGRRMATEVLEMKALLNREQAKQ